MAAQNGHLPAVRLLVERGAGLSLRDDLYQATAERGAEYFGHNDVRDYLRSMNTTNREYD
jgi:ankyrin repeat protein